MALLGQPWRTQNAKSPPECGLWDVVGFLRKRVWWTRRESNPRWFLLFNQLEIETGKILSNLKRSFPAASSGGSNGFRMNRGYDSPNDAPMFDYFPNAIGVANIQEFIDRLESEPAYVTQARCGEGFAEVVDVLLQK